MDRALDFFRNSEEILANTGWHIRNNLGKYSKQNTMLGLAIMSFAYTIVLQFSPDSAITIRKVSGAIGVRDEWLFFPLFFAAFFAGFLAQVWLFHKSAVALGGKGDIWDTLSFFVEVWFPIAGIVMLSFARPLTLFVFGAFMLLSAFWAYFCFRILMDAYGLERHKAMPTFIAMLVIGVLAGVVPMALFAFFAPSN